MCAFDLVVLGSGGGPDETNLSGYLLKPREASWEAGIIALEAGSGMGALARITRKHPEIFSYQSPDQHVTQEEDDRRHYSARDIYSMIKCFLITHAHLDHISSLVMSAGSVGGCRKRVYGSLQTLRDIEVVFNGRVWPNLASWDEQEESSRLLYQSLQPDKKYMPISKDISVMMMPVSHGMDEQGGVIYESVAFFIRHDSKDREFLFFGDVEPDSLSQNSRNVEVWQRAAKKVGHSLNAIFIECSWPSTRPDETLYGHLNPQHLLAELTVLATEVVKVRPRPRERLSDEESEDALADSESDCPPARKRQRVVSNTSKAPGVLQHALDGVRIYITHCKADFDLARPVHLEIADQVRTLVERDKLGAEIIAVEQGMVIAI